MKECFWYELHALTSNLCFSIGCQTRIPMRAYSLLPNPGLSMAGVLLKILEFLITTEKNDNKPQELKQQRERANR